MSLAGSLTPSGNTDLHGFRNQGKFSGLWFSPSITNWPGNPGASDFICEELFARSWSPDLGSTAQTRVLYLPGARETVFLPDPWQLLFWIMLAGSAVCSACYLLWVICQASIPRDYWSHSLHPASKKILLSRSHCRSLGSSGSPRTVIPGKMPESSLTGPGLEIHSLDVLINPCPEKQVTSWSSGNSESTVP